MISVTWLEKVPQKRSKLSKMSLKIFQERLERPYRYQSLGYDFCWIVDRAEELLHLGRDKVTQPGRYPVTVETRSVLCY